MDSANFDPPRMPARPSGAHKGSMGKALLICGSQGMAGAAILAAGGSLRCGVGYALMAVPASIATELTIARPEAVLHLQGEPTSKYLSLEDIPSLANLAHQADAVGIGPGIGIDRGETANWVPEFLVSLSQTPNQPLLLDADALNQVAAARVDLKALPLQNLVLTPHPGEASRLINASRSISGLQPLASSETSPVEIQADRHAALQELVASTGAIVLLKGANTLIGAPKHPTWQNPSGNAGMATAGSGDVLTGVIVSLLARGMPAFEATCLGAFLHGLAGDLAAEHLGQESLVASDLVDYLPQAIQLHQQS